MAKETKEVATRFFALLGSRQFDELAALLHTEIVWWSNLSAVLQRDTTLRGNDVLTAFRAIPTLFPSGLRLVPVNVLVEGDHVAAEVRGYAQTRNGMAYNNYYHFALTLRDGKIINGREYMDTFYANEVLELRHVTSSPDGNGA
jgi:uncharacterized protein